MPASGVLTCEAGLSPGRDRCGSSCRAAGFRRSRRAPSSSPSAAASPRTSTARTTIGTDPSAASSSGSGCAWPTAAMVGCGPDVERELFLATVGGMGLTGLIVEVTFRLQPVETPWMVVEIEAVRDLDAMLEGLAASAADWPYTVGWIDCLARGGALGRGVLDPRTPRPGVTRSGPARRRSGRVLGCRCDAPEWLLNPRSCASSTACTTRGPRRRAPGAAAVLRAVLLSARRDPRLEPPLRPARVPAVPVRAAARGGARRRRARVLERLAAAGAASFLVGHQGLRPRLRRRICRFPSRARRCRSICRTAAQRRRPSSTSSTPA